MTALLLGILILVAAAGTMVVLTPNPELQWVGVCFFGLTLAIMFMAFQAADVALSELTVGAVALPLMILLALARIRKDAQKREAGK